MPHTCLILSFNIHISVHYLAENTIECKLAPILEVIVTWCNKNNPVCSIFTPVHIYELGLIKSQEHYSYFLTRCLLPSVKCLLLITHFISLWPRSLPVTYEIVCCLSWEDAAGLDECLLIPNLITTSFPSI